EFRCQACVARRVWRRSSPGRGGSRRKVDRQADALALRSSAGVSDRPYHRTRRAIPAAGGSGMNGFAVERLSKTFGKTRALDDVSVTIDRGEFFCVVGRTNAGKSTLLKTIA